MPKSLSAHELLPPSSLLTLTTVERTDAGWTVRAQGPDHARCPRCRQVSTARHSRYVRTLKDLPTSGAARFSSGLRTADFYRTMSLIENSPERMRHDARILSALANFEGLPAHARTAEMRAGDGD